MSRHTDVLARNPPWRRLALGLSLLLPLDLHVTGLPAAADTAPAFPVVTGPLFNDPEGTRGDQYRIVDYLNSMLDHAPAGSVARISSKAFSVPSTTDSMVRAYRRGVHVRLVLPVGEWRGAEAQRLEEVIGSDITARSYVTSCVEACLTPNGQDGSAHSKLFLFTETSGESHVSAFTSLNLSAGKSELRYNDVYTVVDDKAVFDAAKRYFDALRHDRYARIDRRVHLTDFDLWFFPDRSAGTTADFYSRLFSRTTCTGVTNAGEEGRTVIRFSTSRWHSDMLGLANQVVGLKEDGCDVRVLVNVEETGQEVIEALRTGGVETRYLASADAPRVHSKFIAISGLHRGAAVHTVYTGSLNPTRQALERSDNAMIRVEDDLEAFTSYQARFDQIWELAAALVEEAGAGKPPVTPAASDG